MLPVLLAALAWIVETSIKLPNKLLDSFMIYFAACQHDFWVRQCNLYFFFLSYGMDEATLKGIINGAQ